MSKKRIVIIDDSPLVLAMATDALESAGYEVLATDSGIEANQYIYASRRPDLILIDVMMPMLNGDRKVRLLKERESSRHIPVILMSTKTSEELQELVEASGADGLIQKPFDTASLTTQIEDFLAAAERGAA